MILISLVIIWVYMSCWYMVSKILKRSDVADVAWGLGFILITAINLGFYPSVKLIISLGLVSIWGIRLASHIYFRNRNKIQDERYDQWKTNVYLKVFMTQGLFMWLICWPIIFSNGKLNILNLIGIIVWIVGFYFESTADKQLKVFINKPENKGKILQTGLWAYSRHPNYFGEVTMWWGIWWLNLSDRWWTVIGPMTITFLILKVSGVPLLEKKYEGNIEFEKYKKRVSVFFPWPAKR